MMMMVMMMMMMMMIVLTMILSSTPVLSIRSLSFPYLRVWDLSRKVAGDVVKILARGKRAVLKCLLQASGLRSRGRVGSKVISQH
jgi:hypothetical protein